jgi:hypothetical protein
MKKIFFIITIICALNAKGQQDYTLQINDSSFDVSLDKEYSTFINDKKVTFKLKQKDILTHSNNLYIFQHSKDVKISKKEIDAGIEQISILTAEGSGLLIQQYQTMNPTLLNELMLKEMTKESINYGFKETKSTYKKVLKSGQIIDITKSVLKYKDEVNIYEIASIGKKDEGILIVTIRLDEDKNTQGQSIIDLMWESLIIK